MQGNSNGGIEMTQRFQVVFQGALRPGTRADDAVAALMKRFGMAEDRARALVAEVRRRVVKKDLDADKAERYRAALEEAGLLVSVEPMPTEPVAAAVPAATAMPAAGDTIGRRSDPTHQESGPEGVDLAPSGCSVGRGAGWIGRGFRYFTASPLGWILATLVFFVLAALTGLVPLIGGLALSLLWPVIVAGFMLGARDQDGGEPFRVGHLFAGFSNNTGQLVLVGLLYLVGGLLVFVVVAAGFVATMGPALTSMSPDTLMIEGPLDMPPATLIWVLVAALLYLPLMMMVLLAPPLVALDGLRAWPAMKLSFRGCLANLLPFVVFGLLSVPLLLIAMVPLGLGLLVVWPALTAAFYAAYREIYHGDRG